MSKTLLTRLERIEAMSPKRPTEKSLADATRKRVRGLRKAWAEPGDLEEGEEEADLEAMSDEAVIATYHKSFSEQRELLEAIYSSDEDAETVMLRFKERQERKRS